jgi:hypothetical protein
MQWSKHYDNYSTRGAAIPIDLKNNQSGSLTQNIHHTYWIRWLTKASM